MGTTPKKDCPPFFRMKQQKIEDLIRIILQQEFSDNPGKQIVYRSGNRLNFSCPYCGDSKDPKKKRGNFYMDSLGYKCYNGGCGIFKDSIGFFKDFKLYNKFDDEERVEMKSILDDHRGKRRTIYGSIDISLFFDTDISNTLIERQVFMQEMGLVNIEGSKIQRYIQRRSQRPDSRFAWHPKKEKLFLLNLTPDEKILGLQIRNMESVRGGSKYLTYKLSGIYEKLLGTKNIELLEKSKLVDPISHVFGIGSLDFGSQITVFEGPMDSWLWNNSVGLCSLENKFPFEIDNIRYWYDWDKSGIEKTIDLLSKGFCVFNWGKFLDENEITKNRKWDLNDLVIHLRSTGKKIKRFDNYFTNDALDLGFFIDR